MAGEVAKAQGGEKPRESAAARREPEAADPVFRERLRERLWKIVLRQLGRDSDDPPPRG